MDYDSIASEYAAHVVDEFESRPFDRGFVASFARSVRSGGGTTVVDIGCGPGQATRELADSGLNAIGVDVSPRMIDIASTSGGEWLVADMRALPLADESVDGVCAWYSIVHTPARDLPALFDECLRVTRAGGWVLLAFQTSAPTLKMRSAFGKAVHLDFLRHDVDEVQTMLIDSGYVLHRDAVRTARPEETASQAFVIARRC